MEDSDGELGPNFDAVWNEDEFNYDYFEEYLVERREINIGVPRAAHFD